MRKNGFFLLVMTLLIITGCGDNPGENNRKKEATMEFDKTNYDFGELEYGSDGICEFRFTNTGSDPLVLTNVKSTCGCTIPEWPKEPVEKNESGSIRVRYDTHRVGTFTKSITVYSNASNSPKRLFIKGRVKPAE